MYPDRHLGRTVMRGSVRRNWIWEAAANSFAAVVGENVCMTYGGCAGTAFQNEILVTHHIPAHACLHHTEFVSNLH